MKIKNCPFCDGRDISFRDYDYGDCWMECNSCKADGPMVPFEDESDDEKLIKAIIAWNHRPADGDDELEPRLHATYRKKIAKEEMQEE